MLPLTSCHCHFPDQQTEIDTHRHTIQSRRLGFITKTSKTDVFALYLSSCTRASIRERSLLCGSRIDVFMVGNPMNRYGARERGGIASFRADRNPEWEEPRVVSLYTSSWTARGATRCKFWPTSRRCAALWFSLASFANGKCNVRGPTLNFVYFDLLELLSSQFSSEVDKKVVIVT